MANQFASISNALAILKNVYQGPIVTQFNDMVPFYREIAKGSEKWNGFQIIRPLKVRRNQGIGAVADGGTLPKIGQQTTAQATISAAFNYLRFGVTGPMIKASQGDKGSFISATEYEMKEGLNDLVDDVSRQLLWDGTGYLATVSAGASSSDTITVTGRESTEDGNKFLDVGMVIDVVNTSGTVVASAVQITAISGTTTATLTLDQNVTVSATDLVIRSGSNGNELDGILTWEDGGTSSINSINRTTYPVYQGNQVDAGAGQLTLSLMQQTLNEARRRGGGNINVIYCDFDSERHYTKLLVADKRYVGAHVPGDGSFTNKDQSYLTFGGARVVPDKYCPTRFFFLDTKTWKKYVLAEMDWASETGAPLIAQTDADEFEARLRFFANLFCEKPSANAALTNYIAP